MAIIKHNKIMQKGEFMKKTYVTTMPDKAGAFLKASKLFADLGINITRVSYNKAVDTHTLFIEADGDERLFEKVDIKLKELGYIATPKAKSNVILLEFKLDDKPGQLVKVLELIGKYNYNISYISSHENGLGYQPFRMGLFVDDQNEFALFLGECRNLCPVQIIEYDSGTTTFDNTIFYQTYVDNLAKNVKLNGEQKRKLSVNVNRAMQLLDERNLSPKTTFDAISKFASLLTQHKGDNFKPRITEYKFGLESQITVIEPPCGSNTIILKSGEDYLFIDTGYAIYEKEMVKIFREKIANFDQIEKRVVLTHVDVDHTGLLYLFDKIYASDKSVECLKLEFENKRGFREQNPLHVPYVRICKLLTGYKPVNVEKVITICKSEETNDESIYKSGKFDFGEFSFDVYLGQGGHLPGEIILVENNFKLIFPGDVFVNLHGYTPEQEEYNKFAPILMSSVDTNPTLAKIERNAILKLCSSGGWTIFSSHGCAKKV